LQISPLALLKLATEMGGPAPTSCAIFELAPQ
jgi:hypothetical protein